VLYHRTCGKSSTDDIEESALPCRLCGLISLIMRRSFNRFPVEAIPMSCF
jgi:hypothetical protein